MREILVLFEVHLFFKILLWAVILDTILGVLRAVKEHKFNSSAGIDGAIRKTAMTLSVVFLMFIDSIVHFNFLFIIPKEYLQQIGIEQIGICDVFCMLFIMYEAISILKNMTLCGLPVPARIKIWIQKFLDDMTDELPEEATEELHAAEKVEVEVKEE